MRKLIAFSLVLQLILVFLCCGNSSAQPLTATDIKTQMLKDWARAKAYTIDYLNTMPADKYSYRAGDVDSARTFAQQMLHLAWFNVYLMSSAIGEKGLPWADADLEHRASSERKDSVMYYVTASYDYCLNKVRGFEASKWGEMV